jgi:Cys-rich protein (TIGR01571 family)
MLHTGQTADACNFKQKECLVHGALFTTQISLTVIVWALANPWVAATLQPFWNLPAYYACLQRSETRERFGIQGSECSDCCVHFWCHPCSLCQEHSEITRRLDAASNFHHAAAMYPTANAAPTMTRGAPPPVYTATAGAAAPMPGQANSSHYTEPPRGERQQGCSV